VQTNCLRNFNRYFLFAVAVAAVAAVFAFVFASAFILVSVVFVSIFVFFASTSISLAFSISFLFVVILSVFFAFLDLFSDCNIEYICKSKKIETELTIYNSCLILLLCICSRTKFLCYIFFDNRSNY